jgi:hypothetical protein
VGRPSVRTRRGRSNSSTALTSLSIGDFSLIWFARPESDGPIEPRGATAISWIRIPGRHLGASWPKSRFKVW